MMGLYKMFNSGWKRTITKLLMGKDPGKIMMLNVKSSLKIELRV